MNIQFLGAAREVTGSCYLLQADNKNIIIDCGLEQGADVYENQELPISAKDVDFVFLTHAHIDHSGKIPLLYAKGFRGDIFTTTATFDLCNIMLRDSAHIQEFEAEWKNRKAKRASDKDFIPLYTMADAVGALELFKPVSYRKDITITPNIKIKFTDIGHLLGSASISVTVTEQNDTKTVVFSGDIGNKDQPILKNPRNLEKADYLIMESTYGDRSHGPRADYISELTEIIQTTFDKGGNVVIPSFAVGRTQELLYFMREIINKGLIKGHDGFKVYVDSPLAIEATNIFRESDLEYFDKDVKELVSKGINPISFPGLVTSITVDESKAINIDKQPKIIISASGMCQAGRIRHHLKHNLWCEQCTILFVGYQANGTIGRRIFEGAKTIKLFGEKIAVKANIRSLHAISGHADNAGLMDWASHFNPKPSRIFVCHGEEEVAEKFAARLKNEQNQVVAVPYNGEKWNLDTDSCILEGNHEYISREKREHIKKLSAAYQNLLDTNERLQSIIKRSDSLANGLLKKFAEQLRKICDKWDN